ncbi:MAG: FAD-dependent monooxygenase [Paracoccaceae bacterium]|jgi:2-octaprenyl-6-methoxyphenol hydroxylase
MIAKTDICISGAGTVGASLALGLARAGLRVALCDPALTRPVAAPFDGAAYAISMASQNFLSGLGVWPEIAPQATEMREIVVADGRVGQPPSSEILRFDATELGHSAMASMVEERVLHTVLRAACAQAGVQMIPHAIDAHKLTPYGWDLSAGDTQLSAPLWAISEGRYGTTARQIGFEFASHDYGQNALATCLKLTRPHHGVAYQYFTPNGPFALLPLMDDHISIVWSEQRNQAVALADLSAAEFAIALEPRITPTLGPFEMVSTVKSFPLRMELVHDMSLPRAVILGDAAHRVHPIAGQGVNLGLGDARDLIQTLTRIKTLGQDIGQSDLITAWARARRGEVTTMAQGFTAVNTLFSNDNPILRAARGMGISGMRHLAPLRRAAMQLAAG